jgi:hypothetical protein
VLPKWHIWSWDALHLSHPPRRRDRHAP